ncbi:major capsid protein [Paenibacillus farraposensis]|uniref:Major capsid protein n=1 Tax=Paenibacillus farraposensis TaxID=2807095 RepID=A0ABW4DC76_9BACL|nr:major capsid protein [Paenibacillus farraposensis]MCC3379907.1 major capsid protein [Paenibacillus farraposensis]
MPDIYSLPQLLRVVGQLPQTSEYILSTFFSDGEVGLTTEIEIQTLKGKHRIAPYVSELQQGKIVLRDAFSAKQYSPVPVKPARNITYHDLKARQAGESLYNPDSVEQRLRKLIARDLVELNDTITRRKIEMASQMIFTGKVMQVGEGVEQELNYGFSNTITLSGKDLWSDPNSDPIKFLAGLRLSIMQKNGQTPRKVVGDYEALIALTRHPAILKLADNKGLTIGNIDTTLLPDGVTYHGFLRDVGLDLYSYTGTFVDDDGVEKPFIPAGTIVLLPEGKPFEFLYAANPVMVGDDDIRLVNQQVVAQVFADRRTAVRTLELQSRPFPVPLNIENWYVAKVL